MFGGTMIIKTIELKTISDILALDIIDFNRLNGYWKNSAEALNTIWSWVTLNGKGGFFASRIEPEDWGQYERADFPEWKHVAYHVGVARDYWCWFMNTQKSEGDYLRFSDSPDFYGSVSKKNFWGDIGKTSPNAFMQSIKQMNDGDLWISLIDDGICHIVLEARYSPRKTWAEMSRTKTLT